jgi:hypothetical protein
MFRWIAFFFTLAILAICNPSAAYDPQSVVISLERGPCFGSCPVYRVTMYGDGTVRYDGMDHVRTRGSQTAVISSGTVKQLVDEIERIGFFTLRDSYTEVSVTDAPTVVLSVAADGKKKRLKHYLGDFKAPKTLEAIETRIDEVAGTGRWTSSTSTPISTQTAPGTVAAGSAKGLPGIEEKALAGEAAVPAPAIGAETEQKKIALHRAVASSLRDEAYAFQLKGQLRDAVIRYRQSLVWWPDAGLETYVEPLERKAGFDAIQYRPQGPQVAAAQAGSAAGVNKPGRVFATIRNRSTQDVIITASGETQDAAGRVRAGEILLRPVQLAPNGEITFMALRNGQTLATRKWRGNPASTSVVPSVLYDDNLQDRLVVMTGLR